MPAQLPPLPAVDQVRVLTPPPGLKPPSVHYPPSTPGGQGSGVPSVMNTPRMQVPLMSPRAGRPPDMEIASLSDVGQQPSPVLCPMVTPRVQAPVTLETLVHFKE